MKLIFSLRLLLSLLVFMSQNVWSQKRYATFEIESPQLKTTKKIWVYLPKDYSKQTRNYPVIYMHDAQNLFDAQTSYAGEWNVDETLDSLKLNVIVIGIEHGNEKRLEELTPYQHEKYGGGNADAYLDFIVTSLKPHVDKTYRTKTKAKHTTIFGSSLGGLVSYYAVLKYAEVFEKAGVFSPSFWFTNDIFALTENKEKINAKLYFLCGDSESEDMVSDLTKMTTLVEKRMYKKSNFKQVIIKDGKHNEKLWRENFGEAVRWLLK
ncbi:alpha/beta hydrolase [Flavobacterium lacus]|uniref:Putative alpha/beta superfamily hydrolase n=1 Tax=Flavobacterium lacus TaxID=1353778 RepID=A0A328WXC8_9FLAO|nr:alpha/beta hydrolase-fold protein [Flavobacterium lacus]RAR50941.1 putative alpha/beta superfamily hydrolase [Flavobacterium lacus]